MASEPETLGFGLELLRGEIEYRKENLKRNSIPWVWSFPSTFHLGDKLSGRSHILIVEDEFLLASDLAQALESAGYKVVGPAPSVDIALKTIDASQPDAAVLDIQLSDGKSFPVARRLLELGLPFVFLTGITKSDIPPDLADWPLVSKLEPQREVLDALRAMIAKPRLGHGA